MNEVFNKEQPAWIRVIDEELVTSFLGVADVNDDYETAKQKLDALIQWHVSVATDPKVNGGWKLVPIEPTNQDTTKNTAAVSVGSDALVSILRNPPPPSARRRDVRAWMRHNAEHYETATELAEAANAIFRLPDGGLDDETHWVWDEAAEAIDA